MTISIRPIGAGDRAAWDPLWQGYLAFYGIELPAPVTEETWRRLLAPEVDMHGLCAAEETGRVVGIVHYLYHPVTWSIEDRCYLEDLFVVDDARGLGAGRALIEAVYAAADERGAAQVYWLTQDFNEPARLLYDRIATLTSFIKYQR